MTRAIKTLKNVIVNVNSNIGTYNINIYKYYILIIDFA